MQRVSQGNKEVLDLVLMVSKFFEQKQNLGLSLMGPSGVQVQRAWPRLGGEYQCLTTSHLLSVYHSRD
jgi:hypothetical protein